MNSTALTVLIAHHRPEDDERIVELLDEHGCEASYHGAVVVSGWAYGADDVPLSSADDLAAALIEAVPFTTFEASTDPTEEFAGHLVRYAPVRGRSDSECGVAGSTDEPWVVNG